MTCRRGRRGKLCLLNVRVDGVPGDRYFLRLVTSQGPPYPSRSPRAHPSGWTRTQGFLVSYMPLARLRKALQVEQHKAANEAAEYDREGLDG